MAPEAQPAPEKHRSAVALGLFSEILDGGQKVELPPLDPRYIASRGVRMVGARRSIPIVNYSLEVTDSEASGQPKRYNLSQLERQLLINGVFTEADEDWQDFITDLDEAKQLREALLESPDEA